VGERRLDVDSPLLLRGVGLLVLGQAQVDAALSRWNRPFASARYVLSASPAVNISVGRTMAWRVFATTTTPLVSRSRRCAGLGLNSPSGV